MMSNKIVASYVTVDTTKQALLYDDDLDGVWVEDLVFLPRNVIINCISLLPPNPPKRKGG